MFDVGTTLFRRSTRRAPGSQHSGTLVSAVERMRHIQNSAVRTVPRKRDLAQNGTGEVWRPLWIRHEEAGCTFGTFGYNLTERDISHCLGHISSVQQGSVKLTFTVENRQNVLGPGQPGAARKGEGAVGAPGCVDPCTPAYRPGPERPRSVFLFVQATAQSSK